MPESEKHTSAAIFFTHSLTLSRSLSVPLSLFSHIFRQLHIRCSLCQLGGASLTRFFYQLALSFMLIIKQHPNIKINTIFKKFIRIRLCYFFCLWIVFTLHSFVQGMGEVAFFPYPLCGFHLFNNRVVREFPFKSSCRDVSADDVLNTWIPKIWWLQLLRSMHLMSFSTTFAWAEKKFFAS